MFWISLTLWQCKIFWISCVFVVVVDFRSWANGNCTSSDRHCWWENPFRIFLLLVLFSVSIHEIHLAMRIGSLCIGGDDEAEREKKWDRTKRMKNVNVIPPISETGNELHFIFHLTNLSFEFENSISSFFGFSFYFLLSLFLNAECN